MSKPTTLQGSAVRLSTPVPMGAGVSIPQGFEGRVAWDEGGDEVVVAFAQDIPNGGFLPDRKQAWIPRASLDRI